MKKKELHSFDFVDELHDVSRQIRAVANLIINQRNAECLLLNTDDLNSGLGEILDRLGRRVKRTAAKIEEAELSRREIDL